MTPLSEQLQLAADRIHLAETWLDRGHPDKAKDALAGLHDELVALAREVDR